MPMKKYIVPYRKPRTQRRPRRKAKMSRSLSLRQPVHYFKRTFRGGDIEYLTPGLFTPVFIIFNLQQLPNYQEFTQLFDQYKILGVATKVVPQITESGSTINGTAGTLVSIVDYNSITGPALETEYYEYANAKYTRGMDIHKRYIRPHVVREDEPLDWSKRSTWIDCDTPSVSHAGIGLGHIAPSAGATAQVYQVFFTFYLAFRTVK